MPDLKEARALLRQGNYPALSMLYDSVPNVLSELTRTAFVPREGTRFIVADFASIERVVLAWLAGERWVLEAYEQKKDLYIATASQMFRVPIEQIGKKSSLRQKGKVADLACGFSGGVGALKAMGALDMGLTEDELQPLVTAWRKANPHIVRFWSAVEGAVMQAIRERTETQMTQPGAGQGIRFTCQSGMLFITLPSGRRLVYVKPRIEPNRFGRDGVTYEGIGTTKKWERIDSFGGKFVENIVQAVSRDILCHALQTLSDLSIVMHVHDEVVIEAEDTLTVSEVCSRMAQTPPWAKGLPLRAEGYACNFYQKD